MFKSLSALLLGLIVFGSRTDLQAAAHTLVEIGEAPVVGKLGLAEKFLIEYEDLFLLNESNLNQFLTINQYAKRSPQTIPFRIQQTILNVTGSHVNTLDLVDYEFRYIGFDSKGQLTYSLLIRARDHNTVGPIHDFELVTVNHKMGLLHSIHLPTKTIHPKALITLHPVFERSYPGVFIFPPQTQTPLDPNFQWEGMPGVTVSRGTSSNASSQTTQEAEAPPAVVINNLISSADYRKLRRNYLKTGVSVSELSDPVLFSKKFNAERTLFFTEITHLVKKGAVLPTMDQVLLPETEVLKGYDDPHQILVSHSLTPRNAIVTLVSKMPPDRISLWTPDGSPFACEKALALIP